MLLPRSHSYAAHKISNFVFLVFFNVLLAFIQDFKEGDKFAMKSGVETFRVYEDYGSHGPNFYIDITRQYSKKLVHKLKKERQKVPLLERQKDTKVEL